MHRVIVAAVAALLSVAAPSAAIAGLPKVLTQQHPTFQVRPGIISYTGDGTGLVGGLNGTSVRHLGRLHWTTYNRHQGLATGLVWLNDCSPNCAAGTFTAAKVHVRVSSPSHGHFRQLTLRYTYRGHRYTDHRDAHVFAGVSGSPGSWQYAICNTRFTPRC